jgi:hypothetical protein
MIRGMELEMEKEIRALAKTNKTQVSNQMVFRLIIKICRSKVWLE